LKRLSGIGTSDGIVIGKCYLLDRQKIKVRRYSISDEEISVEQNRLNNAVSEVVEYINNIKKISSENIEEEHAFIFDVYLMLLQDDMLIGEAGRIIEKRLINAEFALSMAGSSLIAFFEKSDNEYFRERKNDLEHILQKILRALSDVEYDSLDNTGDAKIVVAHDLSPSDTAQMLKTSLGAFAIDLGSKISHTSILARSMGIPAVVGLEDITSHVVDGDELIIDGFDGVVIINPDEETLKNYYEKEKRYKYYKDTLDELKDSDPLTKDGERVSLFANIELNDELDMAVEYNACGIGLYRTEYIYIEHGDVSEEKQFQILKEAVVAMDGKPLIIRTFDLGGEKISESMPHPDEQNPVMGLRAVRYSLRFEEFFLKQLRAILRASEFGDVRIMFPMISGLGEILKCRELFEKAKDELRSDGHAVRDDIPLGVMMELPSLAIISDMIAEEVDFMSVGSNDLIQYLLGIDRNNEYVAYLYRPAHPAVLKTLGNIINSAKQSGIFCSVCGEIAGDPKYVPLLIGLGYRQLSMSPSSILKIKRVISKLNISDCEKLVEKVSECKLAAEAEEVLQNFINEHVADVYFH